MTPPRLRTLGVVALAIAASGFGINLAARGFVDSDLAANYLTLGVSCCVLPILVGGAISRRAGSPAGPLLILAGTASGAGLWRFSIDPWPGTLGMAAALATPLVGLHAVLAHPRGVPPRAARPLRLAHLGAAAVGLAALVLASDGLPGWINGDRIDQPGSVSRPAFVLLPLPALARALYVAWWLIVCASVVTGVMARWRGWRRAPAAARQADAPVMLAAVVLAVSTAASLVGAVVRAAATPQKPGETTDLPSTIADVSNFLVIVLPFLTLAALAATIGWVELVRPRLGRIRDGVLDVGDGELAGPARLTQRLADLLGDPTVAVVFPQGDHWVTADGRATPQPSPDDGQAVTRLERDGRAVAALVHDPADPPDTVALAARLTAAAIDAQRATALSIARAEQVRAATERLVRAGDTAAHDVAERLSVGPIHDLSELAGRLRADPASLDSAAAVLNGVAAEVRALSHGVFPVVLADEGLRVALPSHAALPAGRLERTVELTVYLAACDDPDARVEDRADSLVVTRAQPLSPEALDRVLALGGDVVASDDAIVATIPLSATT